MLSTGSSGTPPWIHSELAVVASLACASVRVIVTAPAIDLPVSCPALLSCATDAFVTIGVSKASVTFDREPHGPVTARDW